MRRNSRPDKNKNKLTFNKETIRELTPNDLKDSAGGTFTSDTTDGSFDVTSSDQCYC